MFISGRFTICGNPACDSTDLNIQSEWWDDRAQCFVGTQQCLTCGADMGYTRRQTPEEKRAMTKKKKPASVRGKKKPQIDVRLTGPGGEVLYEGTDQEFKDAARRVTHRVNTIKPNGGLPE